MYSHHIRAIATKWTMDILVLEIRRDVDHLVLVTDTTIAGPFLGDVIFIAFY